MSPVPRHQPSASIFPACLPPQPSSQANNPFHRPFAGGLLRLRRYARALTHDSSRADDLIQDTLVRAHAKQHLYQDGTNLRAWLFTLMHNQYVNNARRNVREDNSLDVDTVAAHLVAVTDPTASRQLRELDEAIGKLAIEQRQMILLIGLEGMSYEETAAILDVPIGTVRSRLSRGREALRRLMGMDENEAKLATAA